LAHENLLSPEVLSKLRIVISLAGVVRHSVAADWTATRDERWFAMAVHGLLRTDLGKKYSEGLIALSIDSNPFWTRRHPSRSLHHLLWLSIAALPNSEIGIPSTGYALSKIQKYIYHDKIGGIGPFDGIVESAASVLPVGAGPEQWILPVRASHYLLDGKMMDGRPISKAYWKNSGLKNVDPYHHGALELRETIFRILDAKRLLH